LSSEIPVRRTVVSETTQGDARGAYVTLDTSISQGKRECNSAKVLIIQGTVEHGSLRRTVVLLRRHCHSCVALQGLSGHGGERWTQACASYTNRSNYSINLALVFARLFPTGPRRRGRWSRPAEAPEAVVEFGRSIGANATWIPNYGERHRCGEAISNAFVESAVNQVVSRCMVKKQQMRWTPRGAHLCSGSARVLNDDLAGALRPWYSAFMPTLDGWGPPICVIPLSDSAVAYEPGPPASVRCYCGTGMTLGARRDTA